MLASFPFYNQNLLKINQRLFRDLIYQRNQRCMYHQHTGARVVQQELIIRRLHISIKRHCDRTNLDRSKKCIEELRTIRKKNRNPLLDTHAQLSKHIPKAVYVFEQFLVADLPLTAFNSDFVSLALDHVAVDEVRCNVKWVLIDQFSAALFTSQPNAQLKNGGEYSMKSRVPEISFPRPSRQSLFIFYM